METIIVAQSVITFKTSDECLKKLVSGIVETFFPDKKMAFGIEMHKMSSWGGYCQGKNPCRIVLNSKYADDGIKFAGIIAHEIIHVFIEDNHGADYQKEALEAGLMMVSSSGTTIPTQEFGEKIIPVLEKSGYAERPCFHRNNADDDEICFVKDDNGKWRASYSRYNKIAAGEVCRRLDFLEKNVFLNRKAEKKYCFPYWAPFHSLSSCFPVFETDRLENTDFRSLLHTLNNLYFQKKSLQNEETLRIFDQLTKDKNAEINDEKLKFVSVDKKVPETEIFSLSKQESGFDFSIAVRENANVYKKQIIQIEGLCRFLTKCLFWLKQPVKPHVLIRVNQPEETVEEYCSYLSLKLAELFGIDSDSISETEYLPFLEGFGNLICENQKKSFQRMF